jgi:hypothetical protein
LPGLITPLGCNLRLRFERNPHFFSTHESATDIPVLRTRIERNESIAMLAAHLKSVADSLRSLTEYLRALRAFDFDFFVNHEMCPKNTFCYPEFKRLLIAVAGLRIAINLAS